MFDITKQKTLKIITMGDKVYKIESAPLEYLHNARGRKRCDYPLMELKVGEMFTEDSSKRMSIYNAIKHRRNYTKELKGRVFSIKSIGENKIAVIRKS